MNPRGTILVVDDEPFVLQLLARVLEAQGYSILQAGTVELAFDIVHAHDGIISLLIIDHVFLKTTGRQITRRILQMRPSMKVLYVSCEHRRFLIDDGSLFPADAFLKKPFLPDVLIAKVQGLLDTAQKE